MLLFTLFPDSSCFLAQSNKHPAATKAGQFQSPGSLPLYFYLFICLPFDPTNNKFDCNLCRLTSCSLSINLWFEASGTPRRFLVVCEARGRSCSLIMGGKWKYRRQLYPCAAPTSTCRELLISVRVVLHLPLKYLKCRQGRF